MRIDAVFSGGGVKAFAYLGVLESIEEHQFQIERVAGTSAGAIISAFIAAGFTVDEMFDIVYEIDFTKFIDPPPITNYLPFTKWLFLYFQMGINKGNKLEDWLTEKLAEKNIHTFKDIKEGNLKIIASDLSLGKLVVFPDDLPKFYGINPDRFPVAKAVRMSAGFPYFFMPKKLTGINSKKSIIVDGGVLSNFPLWVFEKREKQLRPLLGIRLTETTIDEDSGKTIRNALQMFQALFSTMKQAHDMRYISRVEEKNILFVPIGDLGAVDFHISMEKRREIVNIGREKADLFLRRWPD